MSNRIFDEIKKPMGGTVPEMDIPHLDEEFNSDSSSTFNDTYRRKFWFFDLLLVLLLCGGLVFSVIHAIESKVDEGEDMGLLALAFRMSAYKLLTDLFL